jgi:hypothetical protein
VQIIEKNIDDISEFYLHDTVNEPFVWKDQQAALTAPACWQLWLAQPSTSNGISATERHIWFYQTSVQECAILDDFS